MIESRLNGVTCCRCASPVTQTLKWVDPQAGARVGLAASPAWRTQP